MDAHLKALMAFVVAVVATSAGTLIYAATSKENSEPFALDDHFLTSFQSRTELSRFLEKYLESSQGYPYDGGYSSERNVLGNSPKYDMIAPSHSETNIQVAGVDEADIVKTDGIYAYIASSDRVSVVLAYPPDELANVSVIDANSILGSASEDVGFGVSGIFVIDGELVVVSWAWDAYVSWDAKPMGLSMPYRHEGVRTIVSVFDLSDASKPRLDGSYSISGQYVTSRAIGDYLYLISQSYFSGLSDNQITPEYWIGDLERSLDVNRIGYDPNIKDANSFLNLLSVRLGTGDMNIISIVAGSASTIYMSDEALYLTFQKWTGDLVSSTSGLVPQDPSTSVTSIYKLTIDGLRMTVSAKGEVKGWLLNQFSMDERSPYLRVATTSSWNGTRNNVYILDDDLDIAGALVGLAPSERIYAARYVGDTLYLVTFRQTDPLFVIDLKSPTAPIVVGELSMPGFSSYLHPVDQYHVLGIGSESGRLKVSLYNVSDPANPTEQSKCLTESYAWSTALSDHKAVLFDIEKRLLVIPVNSYDYTLGSYTYTGGAYVFNISLTDGVSLRGVIQHRTSNVWANTEVQRSFYIEDHLYTASYSMLKVNGLSDLQEENSLIYYAHVPQTYPVLLRGD